ncbi:hypothetical protein HMPREF9151_00797 [Hoylesella saccharolytica F0055]|uniref:Uncharacterized protein n=1 Tax=Hoylesella saccharolytica F0055 TaxID=1127699 RepID=L1NG59_9BACT|nr:hypothetical protein HMPREF9151_00797 [Hoylesella saccharolytica F0055]
MFFRSQKHSFCILKTMLLSSKTYAFAIPNLCFLILNTDFMLFQCSFFTF